MLKKFYTYLISFNLPCLIIHGEKDKICDIRDSRHFIENIKHKVKELYAIKEGLHEIYIDHEKEEFRNKIFNWIVKTKNLGKTDKRKLLYKFLMSCSLSHRYCCWSS